MPRYLHERPGYRNMTYCDSSLAHRFTTLYLYPWIMTVLYGLVQVRDKDRRYNSVYKPSKCSWIGQQGIEVRHGIVICSCRSVCAQGSLRTMTLLNP